MSSPVIFYHLKLVAKISCAIALVAGLVLLAAFTVITGSDGDTYGHIVRARSLTRAQLGPAMLVAGLLLVLVACAITSLIVFYSAYRVAGPLYRFACNLQLASSSQSAPLVAIRHGDALARHARGVEQAIATLRQHHESVNAAREQLRAALATADAPAYAAALAQLKALDEHVLL